MRSAIHIIEHQDPVMDEVQKRCLACGATIATRRTWDCGYDSRDAEKAHAQASPKCCRANTMPQPREPNVTLVRNAQEGIEIYDGDHPDKGPVIPKKLLTNDLDRLYWTHVKKLRLCKT
jgi:hypothetical protein